jgi:L-asparaginase
MRRITLVTTGGTIEKVYDESTGELANRDSIVERMLGELRLEGAEVEVVHLMSKDSLDLTDEDRQAIVDGVARVLDGCDGVVVLHGTDTLSVTGEKLARELVELSAPVVLTGAMRPFEMKRADALQNLTEALFATGVLPAGVYCVAHGQALRFPGVVKDRERGTFCRAESKAPPGD